MAADVSVDYSEKYQQLLFDLKVTVEGLLAGQVANVWSIYGGLNRLFNAIEKIFKHGCISIGENGTSDYWQFIQGLNWLQPNNIRFSLTLDCEFRPYLPHHVKTDKAAIWLYRSIESHSLSQKLSWLLSDKSHLSSCYRDQAFLCQEKYSESVLICLHAVERNQPRLLSEINPNLFVTKTNVKEFHKIHRRCSSYPDNQINTTVQTFNKSATWSRFSTKKSNNSRKQFSGGKFKPWRSLPDLVTRTERQLNKNNVRTAPNTPTRFRSSSNNDNIKKSKKEISLPSSNDNIYSQSNEKASVPKLGATNVRRVLINNTDIIEHTPVLSDFDENLSYLSSNAFSQPSSVVSPSSKKSLAKSVPDYGFVLPGEKDFKRKPKKTFMEDGGMSVLPMATGYFPRPTPGQSLTSFLTSSQFVRGNAALDRENAHFSISEAIISALEQINNRDEYAEESDEEIKDLKQRIRMRRRQKWSGKEKLWFWEFLALRKDHHMLPEEGGPSKSNTTSPYSVSPKSQSDSCQSSSDDVDDVDIDEYLVSIEKHLSMSMASLYSESDLFTQREPPDGASDIFSAESVALSLISKFNEKQLPRASDLQWLVTEEDAPQDMLPMPRSWPVSPDDIEDDTRLTPLRGTNEWAPPRPQIIFTCHPRPDLKKQMEKQNYRCAGCGMRVAVQYASKFRYCNYLGRYFCTACHTNQLASIPGRVIQSWDFKRYAVCTFSYRLLEQMYIDPLFRIFELNKNITKRSKNLKICRMHRLGLHYLKEFIYNCRFAASIQEQLEIENSYLICDPEIYSMKDLVQVRRGDMKDRLGNLVEICCKHVWGCELCTARGFICEICLSSEVIFPWQFKRVVRCVKCGSCYHATCWKKQESLCLKCKRIHNRRNI